LSAAHGGTATAARRRDYRGEYARRLARASERGLSRQAGRGHARTPERPERALARPWDFPEYFTRGAAGPDRIARLSDQQLAEWNLLRNLEGKHDIAREDPGVRIGRRQMFGSFEEAEAWSKVIPLGYVRLYPERGAWGARIARGEARGQRAA
jgi:hypothetical protein